MSVFTPSTVRLSSQSDSIRFLLVWRLSLLFLILSGFLSTVFFFDALETFLAYLSIFIVSLGCTIYLRLKRNYRPVFISYAIAGTIVINIAIIFIIDSPHIPDFQWISVIIFLTFFGLGLRWGMFFLLVNILPLIYFILFKLNDHIDALPKQTFQERAMISIEMTACYFCLGYIVYQFLKIQKLSEKELVEKNQELSENNATIQKSNKEKTVLVKEIHHRVKNNLQIIISLLRLQMTDVKTQEAKEHFSEAINRVMVMSSIHQKLYRQEEITEFNLDTYLLELATELKAFFKDDFPIDIDVKSEFHNVDLKTVVPLGLIMNELLSNSFKYAFEHKESGQIKIYIEDLDTRFKVNYSDNGIWRKTKSGQSGFGSELVEILTDQLNGIKTFKSNEKGTSYSFVFQKILDSDERS